MDNRPGVTKSDARDNPETAAETSGQEWEPLSLSPRQRQVLGLLRAGKSNKEIAEQLSIGIGTTKQHLVSLFRKMGVSNRTMAIAKSLTPEEGHQPKTHLKTDEVPTGTYFERRPIAVLSLEFRSTKPLNDIEVLRLLGRTYSDTALDFDAGMLNRQDGKCDFLFGIHRVRHHDVLRAVRAAFSVADVGRQHLSSAGSISAGLAFGYVVARVDPTGEWSGEAVHGHVLSAARQLMAEAEADKLKLHATAQDMIAELGYHSAEPVQNQLSFASQIEWQRRSDRAIRKLVGRSPEAELFRKFLEITAKGAHHLLLVDGEKGMGKTALLDSFARSADSEQYHINFFRCSLPDSQPQSSSRGWLENAVGNSRMTVDEYLSKHIYGSNAPPCITIFDDCHYLAPTEIEHIIQSCKTHPSGHGMIMSFGGRASVGLDQIVPTQTLRAKPLSEREADQVLASILGPGHKASPWVRKMARGVPLFLVILALFAEQEIEKGHQHPGVIPPISLFSLVCERLETLDLDSRLLYHVAQLPGPSTIGQIRKVFPAALTPLTEKLDKAVNAGVLNRTQKNQNGLTFINFSHPILSWICSIRFLTTD